MCVVGVPPKMYIYQRNILSSCMREPVLRQNWWPFHNESLDLQYLWWLTLMDDQWTDVSRGISNGVGARGYKHKDKWDWAVAPLTPGHLPVRICPVCVWRCACGSAPAASPAGSCGRARTSWLLAPLQSVSGSWDPECPPPWPRPASAAGCSEPCTRNAHTHTHMRAIDGLSSLWTMG